MSYLEILEITLFREKSLKPFNIVNLEGIEYVSVSFGEGSEKKWIKILAKKKKKIQKKNKKKRRSKGQKR